MLVSILLPTRGRPAQLRKMLDSLVQSATGNDYEILFAIDDDDRPTEDAVCQFAQDRPTVQTAVQISKRQGWQALGTHYFPELCRVANGDFFWFTNDDLVVSGDWHGELAKAPRSGFIIQPETFKLGGSTWSWMDNQAFPIMPRFCWAPFSPTIPDPIDAKIGELMGKQGWKTYFLPGVTLWHQRASGEDIERHRAMTP